MRRALVIALAACNHGASPAIVDGAADTAVITDAAPAIDRTPLSIDTLGVQGFVLRRGGDAVMTAPLFTRQSAFEVTINLPLAADTQAIDAHLTDADLAGLRAVLSGHAHYDHLMDVPHILERAPAALAVTNLTGRHVLAALAPDRAPACTSTPPAVIARDRVIAMDDPLASHVDYTECPDQRPAGAPLTATWLTLPGGRVRILGLCSMHPAQVGPYHFGAGAIDTDQCDLPAAAAGWLEGQTLAYLIDFLDEHGAPAARVYYQDAPTDAPLGHVPAALLAGKAVDVAILCVGSSDAVADQPAAVLASVAPRFALSGHWEDFFQPVDAPLQPIPLLDVGAYTARANAALPGPPDAPIIVDGAPAATRHILVQPHTHLVVPLAD